MKNLKALSFVVVLFFISPTVQAQQEDWIGSWEYTASQADPPYQKGTIVFAKEEEFQAFIEINENRISAQQVEVSADSASFKVFIEGESVRVLLTKEDEKVSGEATFSGQTIPVTVQRAM
jgi:hypothetical protein